MTTSLHVLLATSETETAQALGGVLAQQGWSAETATDATAALVGARKVRPDAVLLDAGLAGGGALITLKRLRAGVDTAAVPVLVFGSDARTSAAQFLAAGAQEFIAGVAIDAIVAAARKHLGAPSAPVLEAPAENIGNPLRLAALRASGLLDSPPDVAFDRLTRLAADLLGAPTALLSLIDKDRQFFKSQVGLADPWAGARQTPLTHSFCQWVVCGKEPVTVNDARQHPVLRNNLAIRDLGVIAYTGVPIRSLQGEALGSLCAIDAKPRSWSAHDEAVMHDLAKMAESCIAHATLVRNPPQGAEGFDHYVEAAGAAIAGALGILRRDDAALAAADRELLYAMIEEYGNHLVQLNRLIQVHQHLR
jgi:CheY-like chemotaxis protein